MIQDPEFFGERAVAINARLAWLVARLALGTPYEAEAKTVFNAATDLEIKRSSNAALRAHFREIELAQARAADPSPGAAE